MSVTSLGGGCPWGSVVAVLAAAFAGGACEPTTYVTENPPTWAEHFAVGAIATSFDTQHRPEDTLVGPPAEGDAHCVDNTAESWFAQFTEDPQQDGLVDITVEFDHLYFVEKVSIYEGANPGAVVEIRLYADGEPSQPVLIPVTDTVTTCPGVLDIEIAEEDQVESDRMQITVDTNVHVGAFEEIDAVSVWDYEVRE